MNGPQHYAEAQRLLAHANRYSVTDPATRPSCEVAQARALVHATLAVAAATVVAAASSVNEADLVAWGQVNQPTGPAPASVPAPRTAGDVAHV